MEDYINTFPEATQKILREVRDAIRSVVPEGTEETPWHILIKIVEVRIMVHIFKLRNPFVMLCQHFR